MKIERDEEGYKKGCGFRKKIHICKFRSGACRPPNVNDKYGEYCNLFDYAWNEKFLQKKMKQELNEIKRLIKNKKKLKKEDPEKYADIDKMINDMMWGTNYLGEAILYIKRTKGKKVTPNNKAKKKAEKIMQKLKNKNVNDKT